MRTELSRYRLTLSLASIVKTIFSLAELLLVVRIILDFLKASSGALFVQWVNTTTDPLLRPFVGMFSPYELDSGYVIQFHEILAFAVYAFVGYLLVQGITILGAHKPVYKRSGTDNYR